MNIFLRGFINEQTRLESIIKDITENSHLYVKNPEKDFTRNRKLSFEEMFKILLSIGGNSLKIELMEYFSYDVEKIATTSAFIQQREKIKLEVFQELFERFTAQFEKPKTHKGYRLFAIDGSSFSISRNSTDEKTYVKNGEDSKGYNFIHLNALYDLENRIYVGALIQNGRELNEKQALIDIVKNSHVEEKVIVIGDRNYESYNIFENVKEKNWNYIIRLKDIVYGKIDFFLRKLSCKKQTLKVQVFLLLLFCQRQKYLMKKSIF